MHEYYTPMIMFQGGMVRLVRTKSISAILGHAKTEECVSTSKRHTRVHVFLVQYYLYAIL
jgi:hypothetical protein